MRLDVRLNAADALRRVRAMDDAASTPREALQDAADLRLRQQQEYVRSAPWKPLAAKSARRKAAKGRTTRPLLGGRLEKSLTVQRSRGSIRRFAKSSVLVGTSNPVARLHQKGTRRGLPARPVIRVTAKDRDELADVFRRRLMAAGDGKRRTVPAPL